MQINLKYFGFVSLLLPFLFFSCNKTQDTKPNCVISQKNPLKKTPMKVVSVSPAVTEILFALDCGDRLIGRTDFCNYPPEAKNIKSIGGINNTNLEEVIKLKPDLVITSSIFTKKMFQTIEDAGIPIISFRETNTIEGLYETIEMLGEVMDKETKAKSIIDSFKEDLKNVKIKRDSVQKIRKTTTLPKVYYVVGFGQMGDFSAGKNTFINEIITLAQGDNIAKESLNWSFSKEEIFANQPDYIFIRKEDSAQFVKTHPYTHLKAVKGNKVFGIESNLMDILSPRTIKAIEFISEKISD
ncbi:MAG TPA: ABC transporter substrate-binding protein [Bacteroidales bacterium]|nr:ABC transporter substrate-binding protein [Bacteroidales bacterium]